MKRKDAIISDLKACKAAFDKVKITWVIHGGIVLGYARYGDVMEWDTDLDVSCLDELNGEQLQSLYVSLHANGFKFKTKHKSDFICGGRNASFNLFFFHKNGDYYEAFPETTRGFKFVEKATWHDNLQLVDFLGSKYPMPNHLEDFVEAHYGKDWKTNIMKDHAQYFAEKRGDRRNASDWYGKRQKDGSIWWPAFIKIGEDIRDFI